MQTRIIQKQAPDLRRHLVEAVINCLAVKRERALNVFNAVVYMLYAVMRSLIKQTVDQRDLFIRVVQNGRTVVFAVDIRLRVDLDAVHIDLAQFRFSERLRRNRLQKVI